MSASRSIRSLWREADFTADFVGFTVGDVFVAGYGIGFAECP